MQIITELLVLLNRSETSCLASEAADESVFLPVNLLTLCLTLLHLFSRKYICPYNLELAKSPDLWQKLTTCSVYVVAKSLFY